MVDIVVHLVKGDREVVTVVMRVESAAFTYTRRSCWKRDGGLCVMCYNDPMLTRKERDATVSLEDVSHAAVEPVSIETIGFDTGGNGRDIPSVANL